MADEMKKLHKAIYDRLSSELSTPVLDHVPDSQPFPYVTIGEATATRWGHKLADGKNATHTIHIWSRHKGYSEILTIAGEIEDALEATLDLGAGLQCVINELDLEETMDDPDGITRHGVVRFRYFIIGR